MLDFCRPGLLISPIHKTGLSHRCQMVNQTHMATIGYIRVSSTLQVTDGAGLDVQADKIRAWCDYQGLTLDAIESDSLSGATMDRPGFRAAIRAAIESAPGSTLIVYRLDRLGRNAIDIQETLAVLLDSGVRVVSIADGIDSALGLGSAVLKLLTAVLATFAEIERDAIMARTADGRSRAKAEGRTYCRDAPYGWQKTDDGRLIPNEAEMHAIERIRKLRGVGMSLRAIGEALTANGCFPRTGKVWRHETIARIAGHSRKPRERKEDARVREARRKFLTDSDKSN